MKIHIVLPLMLLIFCIASPALALFKNGDTAPDFTARTIDDQEIRLSDLKGKTLLVEYGTTWCPSCNEQAHTIDGMRDLLKELNITYVSVFLADSVDSINEHIKEEGIKAPDQILIDSGEARRNYNIFSIPRLILIDKSFKIVFDAMVLGENELKKQLRTHQKID